MLKKLVWLVLFLPATAQAQYYGVTASTATGRVTMTLVGQELLYPSVGGATSIILQGNGGRITANGITLKSSATVLGPLSAQSGAFTGAVNAAVINVATNTGAGIVNAYNGDIAIGGDLALAYSSNTAVMAHMDGAEGSSTILNSVSPATFTVVNAAALTQTKRKFTPASLYMLHQVDGTYISSLPQISSQTFTADFWLYSMGAPSNNGTRHLLMLNPDWTTQNGPDVGYPALRNALLWTHQNEWGNDRLKISCPGNSVWSDFSPYEAGWHHLALVRQTYAGGFTMYVDGIAQIANFCIGSNMDVSKGAYIGTRQNFGADNNTTTSAVYMDEFRLDIGVARWSANFQPPNAPYYQSADRGRVLIGNPPVPNTRLHINNNGYGRAVQVDAANGDIALNAGGGVILGGSQYFPNAALDVRLNANLPYLFAAYGDAAGNAPFVSISTAGRAAFANTITETYGISAATVTVTGVSTLGGAAFHGAKTHAQLQALACGALPCMAIAADSPYEVFLATGTNAGQWQGQTSGGGP